MTLRRPYCVRGSCKGEVETIDIYGHRNVRKVKDPEYENIGLLDCWIHHCFLEKEDDLKKGRDPCFDEGRMWCIPNNCSIFESKQLYWGKHREDVLFSINLFLSDEYNHAEKVLSIIKELSKIDDPVHFINNIDNLMKLKDLLPVRELRQYEIDRLIEEGEL